jgi:hypothetical protein
LHLDQPHFYWQAGVPKDERETPREHWSFISKDSLPNKSWTYCTLASTLIWYTTASSQTEWKGPQKMDDMPPPWRPPTNLLYWCRTNRYLTEYVPHTNGGCLPSASTLLYRSNGNHCRLSKTLTNK